MQFGLLQPHASARPVVASAPWRLAVRCRRRHAHPQPAVLAHHDAQLLRGACTQGMQRTAQRGHVALEASSSNSGHDRRRMENRKDEPAGSSVAEERGWWEVAEERSLQANAVEPLEIWQAERLEQAFAMEGRRKMKVQTLADELNLDRGRVLAWIKEFAGLPASEREPIVAKRRAEAEQQGYRKQQLQQREQSGQGQQPEEEQAEPKGEGFIPFYTRKEMGMVGGRKRLPAEVQRTLESIYRRTPFPSDDMVRGIWELHKLKREVALEWFKMRREVDGITSSTQRRHERPRGGDATVYIQGGDDEDVLGAPGPRGKLGAGQDDMLMSLMADVVPKRQQQEQVKVMHISRAEMAALRSSMPSRKKARGRKLAEAMGVKMDEEDDNVLQIGDVRYVTQSAEQEAEKTATKWTQAWRYKRTSAAPTSQVVLRKGRSDDKEVPKGN